MDPPQRPNRYADNGITLHLGAGVTQIDRRNRWVVAATGKDGERIVADYDRLLIATGSTPFMPPIPGATCPGSSPTATSTYTDAMIDVAAPSSTRWVIVPACWASSRERSALRLHWT